MQLSAGWVRNEFPSLDNVTALTPGGQKWVFSATHPDHGDIVLKIIKPTQDAESVAREIRAVQRVSSSRVPPILEYGQISAPFGLCSFLLEQRIPGSPVSAELSASGPMQALALLRLSRQMLEALVAAEENEIVHRDIKPGNIIHDDVGDFWLLDFGISRHLELTSHTPSGNPFGKFTPGYAPPEQFRNVKADIDIRADLFALGVTIYECATGTNPFRLGARNDLDVLKRVETQRLPRVTVDMEQEDSFGDLVQSLTQIRRDQRPTTAEGVFVWVKEICAAEGIEE